MPHKELKPGQTLILDCDIHGRVAEGVTLDNLSLAEQNHRQALGCYFIIHAVYQLAEKEKLVEEKLKL